MPPHRVANAVQGRGVEGDAHHIRNHLGNITIVIVIIVVIVIVIIVIIVIIIIIIVIIIVIFGIILITILNVIVDARRKRPLHITFFDGISIIRIPAGWTPKPPT